MYYKLYLDSVFILQMTSNLYLLSLAGKILGCTATHRRIWFGAAVGALMVCMVILVPAGRWEPEFLQPLSLSVCACYVLLFESVTEEVCSMEVWSWLAVGFFQEAL